MPKASQVLTGAVWATPSESKPTPRYCTETLTRPGNLKAPADFLSEKFWNRARASRQHRTGDQVQKPLS